MADADDAQPSLFDRIGGRDTVAAAVDWFYLKVLNDPAVARFFNATDMDAQKRKQRAFREASLIEDYLIERGVDHGRITVEVESRNTFENAIFSRDAVMPKPNQTWLLVTTARHTPRAVASFRKAGWNVIAVPTGPLLSELPWSITEVDLRGSVGLIGLAFHEYLGLLVYRMRGHTGTLWPAR